MPTREGPPWVCVSSGVSAPGMMRKSSRNQSLTQTPKTPQHGSHGDRGSETGVAFPHQEGLRLEYVKVLQEPARGDEHHGRSLG